jgi:hypothetical protein
MGDVINLNQARKAREKKSRERQAAVNRTRFGRDKTERQRSADDQNRVKKELDGKALSPQPAASLEATPLEKDSEPKV